MVGTRRQKHGTITEIVKLWVVIDPIGTLPVFLCPVDGRP